ncbi:MAG TPA: beta-galactosidase GalA, partial [Acidobacteriota bacterium]|nr:beta-galactosidase GalA [Acidobacteriota bacterium]
MNSITRLLLSALLALAAICGHAASRERVNFDAGWRFALGHATDVKRDFDHATGQFSHFAKAGFGAGASAPEFKDADWRQLDLPHDWAVELPFSKRGSGSHGYKAIGREFPENSVGWYRKTFHIPAADLGKRISLEFDGVFRDSIVWVNGHYLGTEPSGYSSFARNISEIVNYGSDNVVVVRVDASLEEGWFYEGAGIYRHVWLTKTAPLHVARWGTFVTSDVRADFSHADVTARAAIANEGNAAATFQLEQTILAPDGKTVATKSLANLTVAAGAETEFAATLPVAQPQLWSLETPALHRLVTIVRDENGTEVDRYETSFGIRTTRWDATEGFFLNGKRVALKGTNNHQDHAGVGVAVPDALWDFRIRQLKSFGANAYRCSHHVPAPELLEACDRLGMLVIDENRLIGTTDFHFDHLERMIRRDRNHPSVILWSVGNEEWRVEGAEAGTRITAAMQTLVKRLDPTRPATIAISGGWGKGISLASEAAGVNYLGNLGKGGFTTDEWHAKHPAQFMLGTEECAFTQTRGVYFDDPAARHLRAYDWDPSDWGASAEQAWSHYAERKFLAGMFVWTGFDYRGEPTPFDFPAIGSQFGILDTCGFPKDAAAYFRAWWRDEPSLHIFPHWNWSGKEGQPISVWAHSNCDEVELFLNDQSLGRKTMKKYSHLEWSVPYAPGTLLARGYRGGQLVLTTKVETTGAPARLVLTPDRTMLKADGVDVAVFSVSTVDAKGRHVPTANNHVKFEVTGGRIIGVGNGDPGSLEADKANERSLFNGYAQVIVQTTRTAGPIKLTARAAGLAPAEVTISTDEKLIPENATLIVADYLLNNNVWGKSSSPDGWQLIDVLKPGEKLSWAVRYNWPVGSDPHGVKCYPSVVTGWQWGVWSTDGRLPIQVSDLTKVVTGASTKLENPGVQNVAYDLWFHAAAPVRGEDKPSDELMIWMGSYGGAGPLGKLQGRVKIDGAEWDLWVGDIGWNVFSFIRTENTTSWRLDAKAFIDHLVSTGLMPKTKLLSGVQF